MSDTDRIIAIHRGLSGTRNEDFWVIENVRRSEEWDVIRVVQERRKATELALASLLAPGVVKDVMKRIDDLTKEMIEAS